MPQPSCRPSLAQNPQASRFITEILFTNDLQRHRALEIDVEPFVSNPHRPATQLERLAVFVRQQFVMFIALCLMLRCRLDRMFRRRLAGLHSSSYSPAKHANRTEFHRSGKLITAARAGALGLGAHGPNRPSAATRPTARPASPRGAKLAGTAPGKLLSRSISNCVFLYTSEAAPQTSEV